MVLKKIINSNLLPFRLLKKLRYLGSLEIVLKDVRKELYKYQNLAIYSPWPLIITDTKIRIVYVNPSWERLTGYKLKEVIGENPNILKSDKTSKSVFKQLYKNILAGKSFSTEKIVNKDKFGKLYQVSATIFPIKKNQKVIYFVQIEHDITERKKLDEVRARYTSIFNDSNDAILSLNNDLVITEVNPATEKLYGYKKRELIGKHISIFIPNDKKHELKSFLNEMNGKMVNYETERINKEGKRIFVAISVSKIFNEKKKPIGYSVIHRDISEKKRVEDLKKSFISVASHELKTPITSLKLLIELHKRRCEETGLLNKNMGQDLIMIDKELDRLNLLITNLLDISRFETGKLFLSLENYNLSNSVADVIKKAQLLSGQKIKANIPKEVFVTADKIRIEQVLINLINNAVKHSNTKSGIDVNISVKKGKVIIEVKDRGVGIPKKIAQHLFEQFYQASNNGGFGLGLFICKSIIDKHKGKIWVKSKEKIGSSFFISLPITKNR